MSARPTIALLTDFGRQDHYVGVMKGVIAGRCPSATLIDITHDVRPQDVATAAYELAVAAPYFPPRTVFLVVVDPGVGTARPAIAAQVGRRRFVGPDNGVFDLVFRREAPSRAVQLFEAARLPEAVGRTFDGRDLFAPVAAALALGAKVESVGRPVVVRPRLEWPMPSRSADGLVGEVIHVDRFGNLVTNISGQDVGAAWGKAEVIVAGVGPVRVVTTYGDGGVGELVALLNSADRLEIAVSSGEAASRFVTTRGAAVRVRWPT